MKPERIQNHTPDIITEMYNDCYRNHDSSLDDDLKEVAYRLFDKGNSMLLEDW